MSSEAWSIYVEDGVSATPSKPFPVLEPRTVKIPPLIVGKDSYGSNGKKFRYGPPPRYLPPMDTGLLSGARVPWTMSPSDHAVSGPCLCSLHLGVEAQTELVIHLHTILSSMLARD